LADPHVLVGAPGWPVVGLTVARAVAPVNVIMAAQKATAMIPRVSLGISASSKFVGLVAPRIEIRPSVT
jgi:hypothetical protein